MELIKSLQSEKNASGRVRRMGQFQCSLCDRMLVRQLENGLRQKSCGCYRKNYNGESKTRIFQVWADMITRCTNPKCKSFRNYGGRGIFVCNEWIQSFHDFKKWALENGYSDNLQIDRRNNNGNYEPLNCRFVTGKQNVRNRRVNKLSLPKAQLIRSLYKTCKIPQSRLSVMFGVYERTIWRIIHNQLWIP